MCSTLVAFLGFIFNVLGPVKQGRRLENGRSMSHGDVT